MSKLIVKSVVKSYGRHQLLKDICFSLNTGEIIGIFGKNGSGKSTLLKILFGTLKAASLNVQIDEKPYEPSKNIVQQKISLLSQSNFLPKDIKVRNAVALCFLDGKGQDKILYNPRIAKIANQRIGTLSHGEMRYFEILLISKLPHPFMLLDEPFSMIEPLYQEAIKEILLSVKQEKGILLTDHYYVDVLDVSDKNLLIRDGNSLPVKDKGDLEKLNYITKSIF